MGKMVTSNMCNDTIMFMKSWIKFLYRDFRPSHPEVIIAQWPGGFCLVITEANCCHAVNFSPLIYTFFKKKTKNQVIPPPHFCKF